MKNVACNRDSRSSVQFSPLTDWVVVGKMREDSTEILFQSFLQEALVCSSGIRSDVHSLTLSVKHLLSSPPHHIYPLTARVIGAPQMTSQPISSIFCLFSTVLRDMANFRLVYSLMLSSHLFFCLVFFSLSLCLARWFWPDLMKGRHVHTTAVCVSLRWSGCLRVVR